MSEGKLRSFGFMPDGAEIRCITLEKGPMRCEILTLGATLRSLWVPDREGRATDVVLGYETAEEYLRQDGYLGASVGRFANRIARGRFTLNGQEYILAKNDGENHLHGGLTGFSHRLWAVESAEPAQAVLTLRSPHGEEGYPGTLSVRAVFTLEENALTLRYTARSDRDTLCSLTNHSYFNLAGQHGGSILDHELRIAAAAYTPSDAESIPLGTVESVAGTPMDFTRPTAVGQRIGENFVQLRQGRGYDHNYVLDGPNAAGVFCRRSGIAMELETDLPGLQLYTANFLEEGRRGKEGAVYGKHHGLCLETQFFPDSPHVPAFPPAWLKKGELYDHSTRFSFSVR